MHTLPSLDSPSSTPASEASTAAVPVDEFFPSGRFAKVPAEALGPLAFEGPHSMEHTEFRLFVALCRFRGRAQVVNPSQETLAKMTGMARNNVSRAANRLQDKGWVRLHHRDGNPRKAIENYELVIPVPGVTAVVPPKPKKARAKSADLVAPSMPLARPGVMFPSKPLPAYLRELDCADFDAMDDDALYRDDVDIDSEPMSPEELDEALTQLELQEA